MNQLHLVREMMFGTREPFPYLECGKCGCLQLVKIPGNLGQYYPSEYHGTPATGADAPLPLNPQIRYQKWKENIVRRRTARYCLTGKGLLGKRFVEKYGRPVARIFGEPDYFACLKRCGVSFSSKILDVGCADGGFLQQLRKDGFRWLTGVDPFISKSSHRNGIKIIKGELAELDGGFDLIMFHHSFEHMVDSLAALKDAHRLLGKRGYALVRVPMMGSHAWRKYGTDWAQIDAPRHLFIHTRESMRLLADQSGFWLEGIEYDSTEFQFWASEQYRADIPLNDERSCISGLENSIFTSEEIGAFRRKAQQLNRANDGDMACFYLQKR